MWTKCFGLGMAVLVFCVAAQAGVLADYVNAPDESYKYELVSTHQAGPVTAHALRVTSQTWKGHEWQHWLTIFAPTELRHNDTAFIYVYGSDNKAEGPSLGADEARGCGIIAAQTGSLVALLEQIPNQPLFDGMFEDEIIAFTFEKFLNGEGDDWPLLLPMVKSTVRAMDAMQQYSADAFGADLQEFVINGASKRGWTTWLTGAVDDRVTGIIPMVIDTLNMPVQNDHVLRTYGEFTESTKDYTERGLQEKDSTPEGQRLGQIIDPYQYRDDLTMPKLVVLGTNDQYWTVDAANNYFPDLKGDKWLFYDPNSDHGLSMNVLPPVLAFYAAALNDETPPALDWENAPGGGLAVKWEGEGKAKLWQATSSNRDFRQAEWTSTELEGAGEVYVNPEEPESGWKAYYVEVVFPGPTGIPYGLTTKMTVTPDTFPFPEGAKKAD